MVNVKLFRATRCCRLAIMEIRNRPQPYTERAKARPAAALIMGLALVFAMGTSVPPNAWAQGAGPPAGAKAPPAGEQQARPPAKPNEAPAKKDSEEEIPSSTVTVAWMGFKNDPKGRRRETLLFLKYQFLLMDDRYLVADRKYLKEINIRADFLALFNKARAFKRKVQGMSGEALFALGQMQGEIARKPENRDAQSDYKTLSERLIEKAAEKGHVAARYIVALKEINRKFDDKARQKVLGVMSRTGSSEAETKLILDSQIASAALTRKYAKEKLWNLAREGYGPAQREVAQRFATGSVFPKDALKAYYWMKRAAGSAAVLSKSVDALGQELSIWQRLKVRYWIFMGRVPDVATN